MQRSAPRSVTLFLLLAVPPCTFVDATLTASPSTAATQHSKPTPDSTILGAYDIMLGNITQFDKPLTLEFRYDPASLDPDAPEGKNLWISSWDPEQGLWSLDTTYVDTAAR